MVKMASGRAKNLYCKVKYFKKMKPLKLIELLRSGKVEHY